MCLDLKIFDDDHKGRFAYTEICEEESKVLFVNFQVVSKRTGLTYDVYAVNNSNFLIFFNGEFKWCSMNQFRPTKTTQQERLQGENKSMFRSQQRAEVMFP